MARYLSPSEDEIAESAEYYFADSPQIAASFLEEVDRAVELIERAPNRYHIYADEVRVKHLDRFPFSIFYRVEGGEVIIQSVAHNSRKPDFWRNRL